MMGEHPPLSESEIETIATQRSESLRHPFPLLPSFAQRLLDCWIGL